MKKKIIVDTNMLMAVYQFKVDIFSELERIMEAPYELFVVDATVAELQKTAERKDKAAQAAKLALIMIQEKDVQTIKTAQDTDADSLILQTARQGYLVATQDKAFKQRLKKEGIDIITLRKKQYLCFE